MYELQLQFVLAASGLEYVVGTYAAVGNLA